MNMCSVDSDSTPLPVNHTNPSTTPGFSMAVMNCQSISSKKTFFDNFFSDHSPDIIAGCESWLPPSISTSEIFPAGYTVYRKDRSDGYGGVFFSMSKCMALSVKGSILTLMQRQLLVVLIRMNPNL